MINQAMITRVRKHNPEVYRARLQTRSRQGLCQKCPEKKIPGRKMCPKHRELERIRLREYRKRVKDATHHCGG